MLVAVVEGGLDATPNARRFLGLYKYQGKGKLFTQVRRSYCGLSDVQPTGSEIPGTGGVPCSFEICHFSITSLIACLKNVMWTGDGPIINYTPR